MFFASHRYHWRIKCGFLQKVRCLETPAEVIPIEVKYTANPRPTDARGVEHFLARHPGKATRGFVVCRAARAEQLTERVRALPWSEL